MTRVLLYNHAAEISGGERSLLAIAGRAIVNGYEVLLCCPPGPLEKLATSQRITVALVAPLVLGRSRNPVVLARYLLRALRPAADLRRAVRRFRPEIVHANTVRGGLIAIAALRLTSPGPRLLVHVRDVLEGSLLDRLTARALGRGAHSIIAISRYVARAFSAGPIDIRVLHNAIDIRRYAPSTVGGQAVRHQLGIPPDAPLLIVAGQISPWKDQLAAIDALAHVRQHYPSAHLLIAGGVKFSGKHRRYDNDDYMATLRRRAGKQDVVNHVHLPGELDDIASGFSAATVALVPSWTEPFGRVIIEAMAARCPVIGTAAGGIPEIITDGLNGLLVPPRDPPALARATIRLLDDAALRQALVERASRQLAERFSLDDYFDRLNAIWRAQLEP
jgi:L-malate glycosyltransferase